MTTCVACGYYSMIHPFHSMLNEFNVESRNSAVELNQRRIFVLIICVNFRPTEIDSVCLSLRSSVWSRENVNCGDEKQLPTDMCLFITFIGKFNFDFRFTLLLNMDMSVLLLLLAWLVKVVVVVVVGVDRTYVGNWWASSFSSALLLLLFMTSQSANSTLLSHFVQQQQQHNCLHGRVRHSRCSPPWFYQHQQWAEPVIKGISFG